MNQSPIRVLLSGVALVAALGTGLAWAQTSATPPAASPGAPPVGAPPPAAMPGPGGPLAGHRGAHCGPDGPGMHHGAMMSWLDTDADGQISRAELEAANQVRLARELKAFDAADVNKDGKLSQDEMRAFRDAMRPPGGPGGPGGRGCPPGAPGGPGGRPTPPPAKPPGA